MYVVCCFRILLQLFSQLSSLYALPLRGLPWTSCVLLYCELSQYIGGRYQPLDVRASFHNVRQRRAHLVRHDARMLLQSEDRGGEGLELMSCSASRNTAGGI